MGPQFQLRVVPCWYGSIAPGPHVGLPVGLFEGFAGHLIHGVSGVMQPPDTIIGVLKVGGSYDFGYVGPAWAVAPWFV